MAASNVFEALGKKNTSVVYGHRPNNGMPVSLLDALETCQGTNSSLFPQSLLEAPSKEELENMSSLVTHIGAGKLQGLLSGFSGNAEVFSPTNTSFTLHSNRHLKIFFTKGVMACNHFPLRTRVINKTTNSSHFHISWVCFFPSARELSCHLTSTNQAGNKNSRQVARAGNAKDDCLPSVFRSQIYGVLYGLVALILQ